MNNIKSEILKSIGRGINVSVFGMEASGHNTLSEDTLLSLKNCFVSVLDSRLFTRYGEDLVKHYLFLSLKGLNDKEKLRKYKNFDEFAYVPSGNKKLIILFKNTEIAIKEYPQIFKFLRGIEGMKRGSVVFVFTGNHHALRKETTTVADSGIFLGNVLINRPFSIAKSKEVFDSYSFPKKWLTNRLIVEMLGFCGGNPNIIQGVARYFNSCKTKPVDLSVNSLIEKNEIRVRLSQTFLSFNRDELNILKAVLLGTSPKYNKESRDLLEKVGLIDLDGKIFSPLLKSFLARKILKIESKVGVINQDIYINGQVSEGLTKSEVVLFKLFLKNEGKIINRDKIFDEVWKGNLERYSDWNLDQLIRRLRTKLARYDLADNLLTVKKRGFMWYFD